MNRKGFYLYILFKDGRLQRHFVKRFSDLSQEKSAFFYYEKEFDKKGKGTCFKRSEIDCFELSSSVIKEWEEVIIRQEKRQLTLKLSSRYFDDVVLGIKQFEVRFNDREYKVGDILCFLEVDDGRYTGRETLREVSYVLDDPDYCKEGYVVLGLKEV